MFGQILGSVVGGLLGGSGSESSQTSKEIDPRLAPFVYGKDGKGGLLGDIQTLYRQQMGQGGLNDLQRSGMESQRQVYASPQFTQGYDAMRSMGLGLMGGGVAQNPFSSGGMGGGMPQGGRQMPQQPSVVRPNTNMQYQPYTPQQTPALAAMNTPIQSVQQYQTANPAPAAPEVDAVDAAIDAYMRENGLGKYATNVNTNYENFA